MSNLVAQANHFYDLVEQRLIIGDVAYEEAINSGASPDDIAPLAELLEGSNVVNDYTVPLEVSSWKRDDYISYGKWILGIINIPLRHTVLHNAYALGLGPEPQRIYRKDRSTSKPRFDGYRGFYEAIGAKNTVRRGVYDNFTFTTLISYVKKNADEVAVKGIRPTVGLFEDLAGKYSGPSNEVAKRITGKPYGKLLDMIGYPEPRSWTREDYIEWGVKFMLANEGQQPTYPAIVELSKRFRGPSEAAISRKMGGIWSFQTVVVEHYKQKIKEQETVKQHLLDNIDHELETETIPHELVDDLNSDEVLIRVAKFWVARRLLPDIPQDQLTKMAEIAKVDTFVRRLVKKDPSIKLSHVEIAASELQVIDYLWPESDYMEYLKVA